MAKRIGWRILLLGIMIIIGLVVYRQLPTWRKADRERYYGVTENGDITLLCNRELRTEKAVLESDRYYLPLSLVAEVFNCRFYFDEDYGQIRYVLPDGILCLTPGETRYRIGDVWTEIGYAPLIEREGGHFLELDWISQYTALEYVFFEEPERLWVWTYYDKPLLYTVTMKKAVIRTLPAMKAPQVAKTEKAERLLVVKEQGEWYLVISENGEYGYVKKGQVSYPEETVRSGEGKNRQLYANKQMEETIVLGWHYVDNKAYALEELTGILERSAGLNVISPTWFTLSDDMGGFVSHADQAYMDLAHGNDVQVWAMVENINLEIDSLAVFSSGLAREKLIDGLMQQVETYGIDGLNLDMEGLNAEIAPHYLQFIRELSLRCREVGIYLSVDNYVPMPYNRYYNLTEQGEVVDYVIIMGYDESWSEPGPNASLPFVRNAIENAMEQVRAEKLVQAVPFYARLWSENADGTWARKTVTMKQCTEFAAAGTDIVWDAEFGCYVGTVVMEDVTYRAWLEEITSMRSRLEMIGQYDLAGIAAWRLGTEETGVWELIREHIIRVE